MYSTITVLLAILSSTCLANSPPQLTDEEVAMLPTTELETMIVNGTLEKAGFSIIAKFRHHLIFAGLKTPVVRDVSRNSVAYKAGLNNGDRIVRIRDVEVRGLGIRKMIKEFKKESENGLIELTVQDKDDKELRTVYLEFNPN